MCRLYGRTGIRPDPAAQVSAEERSGGGNVLRQATEHEEQDISKDQSSDYLGMWMCYVAGFILVGIFILQRGESDVIVPISLLWCATNLNILATRKKLREFTKKFHGEASSRKNRECEK